HQPQPAARHRPFDLDLGFDVEGLGRVDLAGSDLEVTDPHRHPAQAGVDDGHAAAVVHHDLLGLVVGHEPAAVETHHPVAQVGDGGQVVRHQHGGDPVEDQV